eukprot:8288267-Alexandrium_andersonii.AAC.1
MLQWLSSLRWLFAVLAGVRPSAQHGVCGWLLGGDGGCGLGGSLGLAWASPFLWRGAAAAYGGM